MLSLWIYGRSETFEYKLCLWAYNYRVSGISRMCRGWAQAMHTSHMALSDLVQVFNLIVFLMHSPNLAEIFPEITVTVPAWGGLRSWCRADLPHVEAHTAAWLAGCSTTAWSPSEVSLHEVGPPDLVTAKREAKRKEMGVTVPSHWTTHADTTGKI